MPLMKKLLITLAIIVAILLTIPFIGNKFIESELDNRIKVLTSYGLILKESKTNFRYLYTKKDFIFEVDDANKFISYLNQFFNSKIPSQLDSLAEGVEFGLDIEYMNFPLSDSLSLDIFINSFPIKIAESLKANDTKLYDYLDALLKRKSVSCHLNYHILNNDFNGYIKDIDTSYSSPDGIQFNLKLFSAKFSGGGMLMAPKDIASKIKELKFSIRDKKMLDLAVNIKNLVLDFSSNTQDLKDTFYYNIKFDTVSFKTFESSINIDKFNYEASLQGVPKNTKLTIEELVSRGMVLDILDLSLKSLSTAKTKDLGEMSIQSRLTFKEDKDFMKKVNNNLMNITELMDIDLAFKMSKNMYTKLSVFYPILSLFEGLSKDNKEFILFDVKLKDSKLNVNGQGI